MDRTGVVLGLKRAGAASIFHNWPAGCARLEAVGREECGEGESFDAKAQRRAKKKRDHEKTKHGKARK